MSTAELSPDVVLLGLQDEEVETARSVLQDFRVHAVGRLALLRGLVPTVQPSVLITEVWLRDAHCVEVKAFLEEASPKTQAILVVSAGDAEAAELGHQWFMVLQRPLRRVELAWAVRQGSLTHGLLSRMADLEREVAVLKEREAEATRLKSEFLSLVSHELRTPLTEVIGYSELLASGASENAVQFGAQIARSANQLKGLIDDLLLLSKAEAGALPLEMTTFPVDSLVQGKVSEMLRDAQQRGYRVQVTVDPKIGVITADFGKLTKVLQNLISNAVKFSPPGGTIGVDVSGAGPAVLFSVSDTGKGIPQEKLRELFLAFRQEDSSDRRERGGLGIGLSLVKHFVELHGGSVRVASRPGQGTVFSFVVPRRPAKAHGPVRRAEP